MDTFFYICIRVLLWTAGVLIACYPSYQKLPWADFWWPPTSAASLNSKGHFRDLLFVIVPAAVVPLSTAIELFCGKKRRSDTTRLVVAIALIVNGGVLALGLIGFATTPTADKPFDQDAFWVWRNVLFIGLTLTLFSEIGLSWTHYNKKG